MLEKSITPMCSFVAAPMRYRSLFLAGDAAHVVPPTGAKGLNLAVADVTVLAQALVAWFGEGSDSGLQEYSDRCLRARLARAALLVVDDDDAPHRPRRRRLRA